MLNWLLSTGESVSSQLAGRYWCTIQKLQPHAWLLASSSRSSPCRTPLLSHHRYCIEVSDMFSCHVEGNFTLLLVSSNKGVFVENMNDFISASAHLFSFLHFADISSVLPLETGTAGLPPEDVAGPRWSSSGARALAYSWGLLAWPHASGHLTSRTSPYDCVQASWCWSAYTEQLHFRQIWSKLLFPGGSVCFLPFLYLKPIVNILRCMFQDVLLFGKGWLRWICVFLQIESNPIMGFLMKANSGVCWQVFVRNSKGTNHGYGDPFG